MKRLIRITAMLTACVLLLSTVSYAMPTYGTTSDEIKTMQTKLKRWGYYFGNINGYYGDETKAAVKWFQQKNGLLADGIVGEKTMAALGMPVSSSNSSYESNVNLLAHIISAESRGEPYVGMVAVGAVVLNRVKHPSFPNTIAGVIYQPGAFTAVTDGQMYAAVTDTAYKAARDALNGWDPSGGAIYYYNPAKTTSKWIYSREVIVTIGNHVFAK